MFLKNVLCKMNCYIFSSVNFNFKFDLILKCEKKVNELHVNRLKIILIK